MTTTTRKTIDEDTTVIVQRTIVVSTEWSIADLAKATGEDVADVVQSFRDGAGDEWISLYHVAEMVPEFDRSSTADGDVLDYDIWTARVGP